MEISYRREIKHNYLAVIPEAEWDGGYEARMLAGNEVQGLLRMHIRYQDGSPIYYYDITSRQPLSRLLETRFISREEICQILIQIHVTLMRMEEFLLSDRGILLEPEFIYMEPEFFKAGLCLIPGKNGDFPEQLSCFLQYILKCINHKDRDCVVLAYGMYQESLKINYGMEDILKFVSPERDREKGKRPDARKSWEDAHRASEGIDGCDALDTDDTAGKDDCPRTARGEESRPGIRTGYGEESRRGERTGYGEESRRGERTGCDAGAERDGRAERSVRAAHAVKAGRGGREKDGTQGLDIRLPIGKQAAGWISMVLLLPAALWLFRGKQAVFEFRMMFLLADGGLLLVLVLADILIWRMRRTGDEGKPESCMNDRRESAPEPPDSPWRILYEDEDETERYGEPKHEDVGTEGIRNGAAPVYEETFQTTLLAERPADEEGHRLTPMSAGGEEILIPYYPFVIGKHKDLADYVLAKDTVSRFHLRIDRDGDAFTVTDLNSTNGTKVKGRVLDSNETAAINTGDEIYIADLGYIFL